MTRDTDWLKRGDRFILPKAIRKKLIFAMSYDDNLDQSAVRYDRWDSDGSKITRLDMVPSQHRTKFKVIKRSGTVVTTSMVIDRVDSTFQLNQRVPCKFFKKTVWEVTHAASVGGSHYVTAYPEDSPILPKDLGRCY